MGGMQVAAVRRPSPVVMRKVAGGATAWTTGDHPAVNARAGFFSLELRYQVRRLMRRLVIAHPGISATLTACTEAADALRQRAGIGP